MTFDFIRNFFDKGRKERIKNAKAGPVVIHGVGEVVPDHKCPNCAIKLNNNVRVSLDPAFLKLFKYLICSSCGYQKRIKK